MLSCVLSPQAQLSVALNASAAAERAFASGLVTSLAKHTAVLRNALLEARCGTSLSSAFTRCVLVQPHVARRERCFSLFAV
eukprot:3190732-Pleurochrysis_carterae.AAC.2